MPISGPIVKQLIDRGVIGQVGTPTNDYGLEGSPEWNYFQQQVADFRAGRSAYRGQRTKEGSPTFNLSDEEYKKASNEYYEGLLSKLRGHILSQKPENYEGNIPKDEFEKMIDKYLEIIENNYEDF